MTLAEEDFLDSDQDAGFNLERDPSLDCLRMVSQAFMLSPPPGHISMLVGGEIGLWWKILGKIKTR